MDALVSLAASLTEGMRAGVVDPDHVYTLISMIANAIGADLRVLASAVELPST